MQAVSEHLFRRGKRGSLYLRRRIPNDVRDAYPSHKSEILLSLRTSDTAVAKLRLRAALSRLDDEFARRRVKLEERWQAPKRQQVTHLSTQHVQELADNWVRCVLETDEQTRREGLDDDDFLALGERITEQRAELGQLLARGQTSRIVPAMRSFFHLSGIDARLPAEEEQQAAYTFLQAVVTALDYQGRRHSGQVVPTDEVSARASVGMTWQQIFETWRDYVIERPKPTTIACNTAWRQLEAFARSRDVIWPAHVTPKLMSGLVDDMRSKNLAPKTINERLRKIRSVYRIAVGKEVLAKNPCVTTLGVKVPKHLQGRNRRKPFSANDLQTIFGSSIFTQHVRSQGQSGEASYWIPLIMYYSGARPEEIAGLEVSDIRHHKTLGWYLHITDLPSGDDDGLFMDDTAEVEEEESNVERRHLKNNASRRNIPVAQELIALGLLHYVDHVKRQGHARLFPTLQPDSHGKWSGAHGKFFGRYKKQLGIVSRLKSLYSFRHGMKNYLERAKVPSKILKRILGHTTGDGAVTDGYGSDLPLDIVAGYFAQIQFPPIPALRWEPGKGMVRWSSREGGRARGL
jgi:integrase